MPALPRRQVTPEARQAIFDARWRRKNGLEHRVLVSLMHAPRALEIARSQLTPGDFLTDPYAALAALLFDPDLGGRAVHVARLAIAGRPYQPDPDRFDWEAEAATTIDLLLERRDRWRARTQSRRRRWAESRGR